jgi:hypothetical protein
MLHGPRPAALILACALTSSVSYAQLSFDPHQAAPLHSHSGIGPHGDFNGDGREDILASVLNPSTGNYNEVLYLSTADGTYDAPRTMPAYVGAIGDFNHDGKLDFANTESTSISIYLGNGDGTFQAAKTFTGANSSVQSIYAADLNHDNKTDLIELLWGSNGNLFRLSNFGSATATVRSPRARRSALPSVRWRTCRRHTH